MKQTVSRTDFHDAFCIRPNNFSYDSLDALFEYLDGFDGDDEYDLDVIDICCNFSEYKDIEEFNDNYNTEYKNRSDIDETTVIEIGSEGFIIQDY